MSGRVMDALDKVRPYLGSHGGDVELVGISGDTVRLRLVGTCGSCPSSSSSKTTAMRSVCRSRCRRRAATCRSWSKASPISSYKNVMGLIRSNLWRR